MKKRLDPKQVYDLLGRVPAGKVTTYKDIAAYLGTRAYRAVGQIVRRNPDAPRIPCHRVVRSDGTIGGYMGHMAGPSLAQKRRLLTHEGIQIKGHNIRSFEMVHYTF